MSTHLYARKSYYGGLADASQGIPSLLESVKTAFPGYRFVIRSHSADCRIIFDEDLTSGEITTLDGIYTAWDPETTPPPQALPLTATLSTNTSTTAKTFVDLLTVQANLKGASLTILGEVSGECSVKTASMEFQILVDGVVGKGFTVLGRGVGSSTHNIDVAEGVHTFALQWRVTAGSGKINALSDALAHAFLRIS